MHPWKLFSSGRGGRRGGRRGGSPGVSCGVSCGVSYGGSRGRSCRVRSKVTIASIAVSGFYHGLLIN